MVISLIFGMMISFQTIHRVHLLRDCFIVFLKTENKQLFHWSWKSKEAELNKLFSSFPTNPTVINRVEGSSCRNMKPG